MKITRNQPKKIIQPKIPFTAEDLKKADPKKVKEALAMLSEKELSALQYNWDFWARPKQVAPDWDWYIWWISAGRSFGKTRCGAEWVRSQVKLGKSDIAIVGRTAAEVYDICLEGRSGLLNVCHKDDVTVRGVPLGVPTYNRSQKKLTWANGAKAKLFSSEEPEALRGYQHSSAWCDELASWTRDKETWDQLAMTMRVGKKPRICVTTTPRSTQLIRDLTKRVDKDVALTTGSSFENTAMPDAFFTDMRERYEGTRLGRQEIYAEILSENEGALWTAAMIEACQIDRSEVPSLERVVISLDPAVTANVESDLTGIIVAGVDINGIGYILADYTFKGLPEEWATKAIDLYYKWGASRIVYESNQGKDLIPTVMRTIDENIPLRGVHASHSKIARAEPVSALYERGKVKHVRNPCEPDVDPDNLLPSDNKGLQSLTELETQMVTFEPMGKQKSPDRYDSAVWACTDLLLKGISQSTLRLKYEPKGSEGGRANKRFI